MDLGDASPGRRTFEDATSGLECGDEKVLKIDDIWFCQSWPSKDVVRHPFGTADDAGLWRLWKSRNLPNREGWQVLWKIRRKYEDDLKISNMRQIELGIDYAALASQLRTRSSWKWRNAPTCEPRSILSWQTTERSRGIACTGNSGISRLYRCAVISWSLLNTSELFRCERRWSYFDLDSDELLLGITWISLSVP